VIDFKGAARHFTRGFQGWECPQDPAYTVGETVVCHVQDDTETTPTECDTYTPERVAAWWSKEWRYVTVHVDILGGLFGDRMIGHADVGSVESDSGVEHFAELLESLYVEAMSGGTDDFGRPLCGPNLDTHSPEWVVGMAVIHEEDVALAASDRAMLGLSAPVCASCSRPFVPTDG
jgi:hypothetical protein